MKKNEVDQQILNDISLANLIHFQHITHLSNYYFWIKPIKI